MAAHVSVLIIILLVAIVLLIILVSEAFLMLSFDSEMDYKPLID